MNKIIILYLSTILLAAYQHQCAADFSRLNGGFPAERVQFPWQVQLSLVGINANFSGIIIDHEWVLTCAACANKATEYELIFGAYDLGDIEEVGRQSMLVNTENIILHPEYDANHFNEKNIALIHLPTPLVYSAYIEKAYLPEVDSNNTYEGMYARISGYGFYSDASEGRILRYIDMLVLADDECRNINEGQMCTQVINDIGPCEDEGSALTVVEDFKNIAIGIFSYGFVEGSCPGTTTLFTRTSTYLDWIISVTNITTSDFEYDELF